MDKGAWWATVHGITQSRTGLSSSVQLLSHVQLFAILWTVARQASLSITSNEQLNNNNIHVI